MVNREKILVLNTATARLDWDATTPETQ